MLLWWCYEDDWCIFVFLITYHLCSLFFWLPIICVCNWCTWHFISMHVFLLPLSCYALLCIANQSKAIWYFIFWFSFMFLHCHIMRSDSLYLHSPSVTAFFILFWNPEGGRARLMSGISGLSFDSIFLSILPCYSTCCSFCLLLFSSSSLLPTFQKCL